MKLIAPTYYKDFRCLADKCPHSCCIGWRISIDTESEKKYCELTGEYSREIKESIIRDGEGAYFSRTECGRCAHLDERGLCRIYINYGEDFLSDICREHPRFYNRIGDDIAVGVGASCPMAAELILSGETSLSPLSIGEVDSDLSEGYPVRELMSELSLIIEKSESLSGLTDEIIALTHAPKDAIDPSRYADIFASLEYLYPENREMIASSIKDAAPPDISSARRLISYFLYRHLPEAECRTDADAIILFSLISAVTVLSMSTKSSLADALMRYSEEIEYSIENKDAIIEEISFNLI